MLSSATPATASDSSHPHKHRARHRDAERDKRPKDRDPSPRVPSDYIAIKHQLGKGHNATVYLVDWNTDPVPRAMKKIPRNNKRTENMNRLRANNPARSAHGGGAPLPRTADPTVLVDRRGTEEAKIRKEIAIMKKCDHPNIIKFFSFIDDQMSANICLILEYMEGGELQWHADNGAPYLTMDQTRRCTRDIVLGLQYLHLQGIIHRDIKPSNIMWTADRSHVKIGDFGVAHLVTPAPGDDLDDTAESSLRHAGTPAFLAPEIAPGAPVPHLSSSDDLNADDVVPYASVVSPAVDLWALGVTLYCMLFGRMPFNPSPEAAGVAAEASVYRAIREEEWTLPGGRGRGTWAPPSCGSECMCSNRVRVEKADWSENGVLGLLAGLLIKDPRERWGIEQVKDVAWLLHDIQRRQEWIQGTTPQIVVSAADEANAILEPKYKWNLKAAVSTRLGRRFSNFFRARERDEEGGTGYVRSEPNVDVRESRRAKDEKGKGRAKPDSGKTGAMKDGKTKKSRSVDARSQRLEGSNLEKPRRGSESVTTLPPPPLSGESPTTTRRARGLFRWGGGRESPSLHPPSSSTTSSTAASSSTFHSPPSAMTTTRATAPPRRLGVFGRARHPFSAAARHSTEALGSASMVPPPFFGGAGVGLGAEQRTASMADARITTSGLGLGGGGGGGTGAATDSDGDGDGAGAGIGKGMIAAPRATVVSYHAAYDAQRKEEEVGDEGSIGSGSESGCSYGSGARSRDGWRDLDVDDGDPYTDDYDDDGDDSPRADVYDSTSSGDEENVPITFKGARQRAELTTSPPNGHGGAGTNANGGASLNTDVDSNATEADAPPPPDSDPEDNEDDKRQASLTIPNGPGL